MSRPAKIHVPILMGTEGVDALLTMTPEEAQRFARAAAHVAIRTGNLSRGLREALTLHVNGDLDGDE